MKRILFVTNTSSLGGASLSLLQLLAVLPRDQYTPHVLLPDVGPLEARLRDLNVTCTYCYHPSWVTSGTQDAWLYAIGQLPICVEAVRKHIQETHCDLIFTNSSVVPTGAIAAAIEGVPHLWRVREFFGGPNMMAPIDSALLRKVMLALSTAVCPITHALAQDYVDADHEDKVHTVQQTIDTCNFADVCPSYDAQTILSIGTNSKAKGLTDLVNAASLMARQGTQFRILVLGSFYYESYLRDVKARLKSEAILSRFEFVDYQDDIRPWLSEAAVLCCPSHSEGMSRTILEGMAAGLPVVSTDCGGPRDLVVEGETGQLVPVANAEALANALTRTLASPEVARQQGEAGRKRARNAFAAQDKLSEMIVLLDKSASVPACSPDIKALCQLMLAIVEETGPRTLLGKKWRLMKPLMELSERRGL